MNDFTNKEIAEGIRLLIDSKSEVSYARPYLGMSQLGKKCSRALWYDFRWAKAQTFSARTLRIFSRGHHEEPRILQILENIGVTVDESQTPMEDCEGHLRGHSDAILCGVPDLPDRVLGEFKTTKDSSWQNFNNKGVLETNQQYYAQCQLYMYYLDLEYTLFIAVNKDTEELYIEVIPLNKRIVEKLQSRATDIINASVPPARAFESSTYYECNWCTFKGICWENNNYDRNCRTCKYSAPSDNGHWVCELLGTMLSVDFQRKGCNSYDSKT